MEVSMSNCALILTKRNKEVTHQVVTDRTAKWKKFITKHNLRINVVIRDIYLVTGRVK